MAVSTALIATSEPGRVLRRLCRHWQHKFEVSFNEQRGEILLEDVRCELLVREGALEVLLHVPDPAQRNRFENVLADHIQRMAGSETLVIDWHPGGALYTL